jgi:transcriptional regulator with XRE-family HTH domain
LKKIVDPKSEEFARLIAMTGWTQAEVARRLQITPGAVSQLCSGKTRPHARTLNLLKLIIAHEMPDALRLHESQRSAALGPWESELLEGLRRLRASDRERLLPIFHQLIGMAQQSAKALKR